MRKSPRWGTTSWPMCTRALDARRTPSAKPPRDEGWSDGVRVDVALLASACCLTGCVARQSAPAATLPQHVLVVTIDTLRADRLGCYGNREVATPNLDRIAHEGAIAPDANVPTPITRPSHVSIFTGLYPAQHGIRDNISRALASDVPTLAEAFKAAGFETAGFVSS